MAIQTYEGLPLCHWCLWPVFEELEEYVGDENYIAHDDCHEMQT